MRILFKIAAYGFLMAFCTILCAEDITNYLPIIKTKIDSKITAPNGKMVSGVKYDILNQESNKVYYSYFQKDHKSIYNGIKYKPAAFLLSDHLFIYAVNQGKINLIVVPPSAQFLTNQIDSLFLSKITQCQRETVKKISDKRGLSEISQSISHLSDTDNQEKTFKLFREFYHLTGILVGEQGEMTFQVKDEGIERLLYYNDLKVMISNEKNAPKITITSLKAKTDAVILLDLDNYTLTTNINDYNPENEIAALNELTRFFEVSDTDKKLALLNGLADIQFSQKSDEMFELLLGYYHNEKNVKVRKKIVNILYRFQSLDAYQKFIKTEIAHSQDNLDYQNYLKSILAGVKQLNP